MALFSRQRICGLVTLLIGATLWSLASRAWVAPDGSTGLSLLDGRAGVLLSLLTVLVVASFVAIPALATSAMGNQLKAPALVAIALVVPAWRAGPIDGWIYRHDLPSAYVWLIAEVLLWFTMFGLLLLLARWTERQLPQRWPQFWPEPDRPSTADGLPETTWTQSLAGFACATFGGALIASALIHTTDPAQVTISLIIAFIFATMGAQFAFPKADALALLMSPAAFAILAYARVALAFDSQPEALAAWYSSHGSLFAAMAGGAQALPIHYASAGISGAALGTMWAQGWERTD